MCIGKKARLKPTKMSQKLDLAEPLVEHPARDLRQPVVEPGEDREDGAAEEHVVEVGDDEVGVRHLLVERDDREHDAGQPADHEVDEEAEHVQERRLDDRPPAPDRGEPGEDLHPLGIAIIMLAAAKNAIEICGRPTANMWCTQTPKPMSAVATVASATHV